jgi:Na+/phosphate symporter
MLMEGVSFLLSLFAVLVALAIFFCSLFLLKESLEALQPRVGPWLRRATGHPLQGALLGFLVTALIQSSSATNSMVVGLVAAGVLRLKHAFAVILGANVGTTITGQIVALGLGDLGLPLLVAGFFLQWVPRPGIHAGGKALMGVGGLFYGLWALGGSLAQLGAASGLGAFLAAAQASDGASLAAGALLTAVVQSSSAVTSLLVGLADAGVLPVRAAIAATLGSNIGTVTTTILASLSGGPLARRAAWLDLGFNLLGALIALVFMPYLAPWLAGLAVAPGRQVAHAHTLFNVITVAVALPFVDRIARLAGDQERSGRD